MSSGIITHAPAAAMAEISSPVDGVDFGMFVHRGHPRLHQSSDTTQISSARGVPLCSVASRMVVTTDASTHGWGAVCEGMPASGLWLESQSQWHINRLELEAVFLAQKDFQPQLEQQHVLIRTDNTSVVSYINHQGGIRSRALCKQATDCHPLHQSSAHPRSPDPRGGHAFEEGDSSRRVEIAPRVGSDDLEPLTLRESGGGSVRHERERALPAVLHSDITLASSQAVCISSDQEMLPLVLCKHQ